MFLFVSAALVAQGFNIKVEGTKTFTFEDKGGRNQATFFSTTPLEDITGTANGVKGSVSFDVKDVAKTIKGSIVVTVESMKSGIDLRDEHLKSANWLDAEKYPEIKFEITSLKDVISKDVNKMTGTIYGKFTLHGVTKEISAPVELTYLVESEQTKKRAPGDLLGVNAQFNVRLSDFGINNDVVGNKVAEDIEIKFGVVGHTK